MSQMRIDAVQIRDADIFEILLDSFPDMIHSIDDNGNIVYTNKTAEKLLGYTKDEFSRMNIRQIYAPEILALVEKGFSDLKQKGDKTVESLLISKTGVKIPVEIRSFSIYDDNGNFLRTFSILRDIRQIKELQDSLVHAGRLAAIGELASGVAHDINNPLTVILLSLEMLGKQLEQVKSPPDDKALERSKSFTKDIQKASKSIQKLADHLRNFSRGMAEKYEIFDLSETVNDAVFITGSKVTKTGSTVINNVAKGKYYVNGLPNQLEQVFVNLIGNACDAMENKPKRELTLSVSSTVKDGVDCWVCDVQDSGSGIPPEIMEEIFHSFFTTKEKGKGTGLGLSISRGIVRDHKGDIALKSVVGQGSVFSVILPKASI